MSKILYIFGDHDYAATEAENYGIEKLQKEIESEKYDCIEFEDGCYAQIIEFNNIDPKFIDWIKENIQDYDDSKHTNFWLL